jgi:hypothetical protein
VQRRISGKALGDTYHLLAQQPQLPLDQLVVPGAVVREHPCRLRHVA